MTIVHHIVPNPPIALIIIWRTTTRQKIFKNYHHWKRSLMQSCTYTVATFLKRKSITYIFLHLFSCKIPTVIVVFLIKEHQFWDFFLPCANFLGQGHLLNLDFSVNCWLIKTWAKCCPTCLCSNVPTNPITVTRIFPHWPMEQI